MGNRAYFTLEGVGTPKTYYVHWNGGMDTFSSLSQSLFDLGIIDPLQVQGFLKELGIKAELQTEKEAYFYKEENGHYYIDLAKKELRHSEEKEGAHKKLIPDLKRAFDEFVSTRIREEYRQQVIDTYWHGVQQEAKIFFLKGSLK